MDREAWHGATHGVAKSRTQKYLSAETYEAMRTTPKKNHNTEIISL